MKSMNQNGPHISEEQMLLYCTETHTVQFSIDQEAHLQTCPICQALLSETRQQIGFYRSMQSRHASRKIVYEAHQRLMQEIVRGKFENRRSVWEKSARWLAVAASLVISFCIGRLTVGSADSGNYDSLLAAYRMTSYGTIQVDPESQELTMILPQVENQIIKGSLKDVHVQRLAQAVLQYDIRDDVRMDVFSMINSDMLVNNPELASTVMFVVEHDTNPGLRLRAMRLLERLPASPELLAVLKRILMKGEIEGIRVQAARYLATKDYKSSAGFIKQFAGDDEYMRSLVIRAELPLS